MIPSVRVTLHLIMAFYKTRKDKELILILYRKKIEDIPEERRHRLLQLVEPRSFLLNSYRCLAFESGGCHMSVWKKLDS